MCFAWAGMTCIRAIYDEIGKKKAAVIFSIDY